MRDDYRYASAEVSAQDALDAAIERAARTQHALILAEAQVRAWQRQALALREKFGVGEVEADGETSDGGGAAAVGSADSEGPVPA